MVVPLHPPLLAKDPLILQVLGIARISTEHQEEVSLDAQKSLIQRWLDEHWEGPYELTMISGRGSGERLDRDDVRRAWEGLDSERYDLVIAEDLGRIMRRTEALRFCETAEDVSTRVIALNDHLDTAQENWRLTAMFATLHHEQHNADISKRIRRSLRERFRNGGAVHSVIFGHIKPPGCKSDADLRKDPAAEPIYEKWFSMLEASCTFAEVADWLNAEGISTGPNCRRKKWDVAMVARLTRNPILKGLRQRNRMTTRRENRSGRRKPVKAPASELLERQCPHLAFIDPERYDRLIATLNKRNAGCRRRKINGRDPRAQVPKKRTRFPGQTVYCGVCGRMYVYAAHGRSKYLMCSGAREYLCWNGVSCSEEDTRARVCEVVFGAFENLPDFEAECLSLLRQEEQGLAREHDLALQAAEAAVGKVATELEHLMAFIRSGKAQPTLHEGYSGWNGIRRLPSAWSASCTNVPSSRWCFHPPRRFVDWRSTR